VQLASDGVQCTVVTALGPGLLALQAEVVQQELLAGTEPPLEVQALLLVGLLALVQHRELRALVEQQAVPLVQLVQLAEREVLLALVQHRELVPLVQLAEMEVLLAQMAEQVRQLEFLEQVQELQPCVLWERAADHRLSLVDPFFVLLETRVAHSAEDLIVEGPIVGLNAEQALEQTSANSAVNRMTACDDMIDLDTHIAASYPVDIDDVPQYHKKPVLPVSSNQRIPL